MKNFDVADIVHAIREESHIKAPLEKLLKLPAVERCDALKKLAFSLKGQGAPQSLVDVVLTLQKTDLARRVLIELENRDGKWKSKIKNFFN